MEKITFGPIKDKAGSFTVEPQWCLDEDCKVDCTVTYFEGNDGGVIWHGCKKKTKTNSNILPIW